MAMGRKTSQQASGQDAPRSFDDFHVSLGDAMRGERATLGKSLLDVQRELKIKATYIAAIEKGDPGAFETQGFISGYVRSYARYLGMDPDHAFETFCRESGYQPAHGLSALTGAPTGPSPNAPLRPKRDIFAEDDAYAPGGFEVLGRIDFGAAASVAVLALVVGAVGWGGWSVLKEVQRVSLAPVNAAPGVMSEVDPLASGGAVLSGGDTVSPEMPDMAAFDRLYRPRALDVPVLVARDGPIAAIDPRAQGVLAAPAPARPEGGVRVAEVAPEDAAAPAAIDEAVLAALGEADLIGPPAPPAAEAAPQVTAQGPQPVTVVAARETWVRIRDAGGSTLFEGVMQPGDRYEMPLTEEPARLRTGNARGVYFETAGATYGPAGDTSVLNVDLSPELVASAYEVADPNADPALARVVAEAAVD